MDLGELTIESAKELEGTTFELLLPDDSKIDMKVEEVVPFPTHQRRRGRGGPATNRAPFSIYFLGPPSLVLPQGMYTFRSPSMTFDQLFIVPVGHDEEATEYEAVFT